MPGDLNTFIRDHCIYWEYQVEKAKTNLRLPFKKGEGGWYEAMGKKYDRSPSAIETIVTNMRKIDKS